MTGYLSRDEDTVQPFPWTCPKCGAAIGANPQEDVLKHFARQHSISIGYATRREMPGMSEIAFAYVGPVYGVTRRSWWVVVFDFPFELVKIRPDEWAVTWSEADGPATEGVIS